MFRWHAVLKFYAEGGQDGGERARAAIEPPQPELDAAYALKSGANDVIVLTYGEDLTEEQAKSLREQAKPFFPNNEVVVLSGGLDFDVR